MAIKFVRLYGFSHENSFETDHFIGIEEDKKRVVWIARRKSFYDVKIL